MTDSHTIALPLPPPPDNDLPHAFGYLSDGQPADAAPAFWVLIYNRRGPMALYRNRCPHTGAPMEWMPHTFLDFDSQFILCALHGATFSLDAGQCVSGPCRGEALQRQAFERDGDFVVLR